MPFAALTRHINKKSNVSAPGGGGVSGKFLNKGIYTDAWLALAQLD